MPLSKLSLLVVPTLNPLPVELAELLVVSQYLVLAASVVLAGAVKVETVLSMYEPGLAMVATSVVPGVVAVPPE